MPPGNDVTFWQAMSVLSVIRRSCSWFDTGLTIIIIQFHMKYVHVQNCLLYNYHCCSNDLKVIIFLSYAF